MADCYGQVISEVVELANSGSGSGQSIVDPGYGDCTTKLDSNDITPQAIKDSQNEQIRMYGDTLDVLWTEQPHGEFMNDIYTWGT